MSIDITRIGGRIGAEISGVDLTREITETSAREIHDALVAHKVLVFRGQHLDDDQHQRFASIFGTLTLAHPTVPSVDGQANVLEVAAGPGARANAWHTDVTFVVAPPKATTLRSLVIPPYGGDTLFSNTAAYSDLPDHLRILAGRLFAEHSNEYDYAEHPQFLSAEVEAYQKVFTSTRYRTAHPVVRVNPDSGVPNLFIGNFVVGLIGLSKTEGRDLLRLLQHYVTRPENTLRHKWQVGDIVVWDNRSTQHYAADDYGDLPRKLHRVTVAGDVPYSTDGTKSWILEGDEATHYTPQVQ
ncbi:TauD/TfdA dioxygenase family protein [Actinoplanes derwentensis]|uniref:Taurine dioxygenase n=1 Tax=Actinoplanes derwentensis TaxID=113562 RepID=A0A1H2AHY4_9ACTN|nr:TauD/TfdA family dioxygenase [Actinoplanes derwentensis]GID90259.1 taurine dioxygenase [Actinoplanes derwentensis]SDT45126.1 taurine dioxygenase [Actinoplanes derwentensis]